MKLKNCSSKYKGVCIDKSASKSKPWLARIVLNKKQTYLGCFSTEEEAAVHYDTAAIKLFGEFARLNFPAHGGKK